MIVGRPRLTLQRVSSTNTSPRCGHLRSHHNTTVKMPSLNTQAGVSTASQPLTLCCGVIDHSHTPPAFVATDTHDGSQSSSKPTNTRHSGRRDGRSFNNNHNSRRHFLPSNNQGHRNHDAGAERLRTRHVTGYSKQPSVPVYQLNSSAAASLTMNYVTLDPGNRYHSLQSSKTNLNRSPLPRQV